MQSGSIVVEDTISCPCEVKNCNNEYYEKCLKCGIDVCQFHEAHPHVQQIEHSQVEKEKTCLNPKRSIMATCIDIDDDEIEVKVR
jgi:hypothetical protein